VTPDSKSSGKFILLVKAIEDKKIRYNTTKKLGELFPGTPFTEWKAKIDKGEPLVLLRADTRDDLDKYKKDLDAIGAPSEIVEQKSIGGARIF